MKNSRQILLFFLMLLGYHTNIILAYGNFYELEKTKNICCLTQDLSFKKMVCCDQPDKNTNGCNQTCNDLSCTCPGTVNPTVLNGIQKIQTGFDSLDNRWVYVQLDPESVYTSIWQLPKIS